MIPRIAQGKILEMASKMPVISITGPRQSGKTTLARLAFPEYLYVNLELPENRELAEQDPKGFMRQYSNHVIIDEVQYVPELFSYIQSAVDETGQNGMYILTGSNNFLLHKRISQSLAGRVYVFHLLPLSYNEMVAGQITFDGYEEYLLAGSYPRLYSQKLQVHDYYPSYIETYLERDIRQTDNIRDLRIFRQFLQICAGNTGQVVNLSDIGSRLGIDHKTARRWLGILEAAYVIYLLPSWHKNFNKRLIKSPKLYFYDTGIACSLLRVKTVDDLRIHFTLGSLFENMVITEILKDYYNMGERPELYFWRDHHGVEVDLIIDRGSTFSKVEIKSARTIHKEFLRNLSALDRYTGRNKSASFIIYGGDAEQYRTNCTILSWRNTSQIHY